MTKNPMKFIHLDIRIIMNLKNPPIWPTHIPLKNTPSRGFRNRVSQRGTSLRSKTPWSSRSTWSGCKVGCLFFPTHVTNMVTTRILQKNIMASPFFFRKKNPKPLVFLRPFKFKCLSILFAGRRQGLVFLLDMKLCGILGKITSFSFTEIDG